MTLPGMNLLYMLESFSPDRVQAVLQRQLHHCTAEQPVAWGARQNPEAVCQKRAARKRPAACAWLPASGTVELYATDEPYNEEDDQYEAENPTEARSAVAIVAIVSAPAA